MNQRVVAIQSIAEQKEKAKAQAELEKEERICGYMQQILALKLRIDELIEVGNACKANAVPLERTGSHVSECYAEHHFITNGWSHLLGFVDGGKYPFKKIGIQGGGACNYYLATDGVNVEVAGEKETVLRRFVNEFPVFEKLFYEYVDNFIKENMSC